MLKSTIIMLNLATMNSDAICSGQYCYEFRNGKQHCMGFSLVVCINCVSSGKQTLGPCLFFLPAALLKVMAIYIPLLDWSEIFYSSFWTQMRNSRSPNLLLILDKEYQTFIPYYIYKTSKFTDLAMDNHIVSVISLFLFKSAVTPIHLHQEKKQL